MTPEHGYWVMKIMFYTNQKHLDEPENVQKTRLHHLDMFLTLSDFLEALCSSELFDHLDLLSPGYDARTWILGHENHVLH